MPLMSPAYSAGISAGQGLPQLRNSYCLFNLGLGGMSLLNVRSFLRPVSFLFSLNLVSFM